MLTFVLAAADSAAGDIGHAEVFDPANILPGITAMIVFLAAFGILAWKVWPPIIKALDEREAKIRQEIASAEQAREQAKAALAEYQRSLASAREEANQMIAKARADAKATAEEVRARIEAEAAESKARAMREIESAKQAAVTALYAEASNLAVAIASKILQREINSQDQQRLVDASLQELTKIAEN